MRLEPSIISEFNNAKCLDHKGLSLSYLLSGINKTWLHRIHGKVAPQLNWSWTATIKRIKLAAHLRNRWYHRECVPNTRLGVQLSSGMSYVGALP